MKLFDLTPTERLAAVLLSFHMLQAARRRGSNPPFGLYVAEFAGTPFVRVAWMAADLAKKAYEASK